MDAARVRPAPTCAAALARCSSGRTTDTLKARRAWRDEPVAAGRRARTAHWWSRCKCVGRTAPPARGEVVHGDVSRVAADSGQHGGGARVRRVHAAFAGDDDDTPPHHLVSGKEKKEKSKKTDKQGESGAGDAADKENKSAEEKRKHIKSLIDKIPTQKDQLFQYKLDTSQIDNGLMEKKIRPWINKKIIEYIGEPEPTLVDFICSKVLAGSAPQGILDDVQMVLDEEAEVFVVKMWRLLIYELEAKRAGLHAAK